jgi:hypothetical protein
MICKPSDASVAQLVEHHLAKVNVEGSNPFARSIFVSAICSVSGKDTKASMRLKFPENPFSDFVPSA